MTMGYRGCVHQHGKAVVKKQRTENNTPKEPYLGGRGVRTLPPGLRFEKLLKVPPDSLCTCIHVTLRRRTLPVTNLDLKYQVSLMESHPFMV